MLLVLLCFSLLATQKDTINFENIDNHLKVRSNNANESTILRKIAVSENNPPFANFNISTTEVLQNEFILLDASGSSDPEGQKLYYIWTMPNGRILRGKQVETVFYEHGKQQVKLDVYDESGNKSSVTKQFTVTKNSLNTAECSLDFTGNFVSKSNGYVGEVLIEIDRNFNGTNITSEKLYIEGNEITYPSNQKNFVYSFKSDGIKNVRFAMSNKDGETKDCSKDINIIDHRDPTSVVSDKEIIGLNDLSFHRPESYINLSFDDNSAINFGLTEFDSSTGEELSATLKDNNTISLKLPKTEGIHFIRAKLYDELYREKEKLFTIGIGTNKAEISLNDFQSSNSTYSEFYFIGNGHIKFKVPSSSRITLNNLPSSNFVFTTLNDQQYYISEIDPTKGVHSLEPSTPNDIFSEMNLNLSNSDTGWHYDKNLFSYSNNTIFLNQELTETKKLTHHFIFSGENKGIKAIFSNPDFQKYNYLFVAINYSNNKISTKYLENMEEYTQHWSLGFFNNKDKSTSEIHIIPKANKINLKKNP
tara:strand:- start:52085 stop:53683 length:1599 start_codon:yes stop_codon:yes gene_type:complete